jgi:carbon storage regulator CsrA
MLVLTRHMGEELSIPSLGVSIKIVSTQGNRTRIGINAPIDIEIRRAELTAVTEISRGIQKAGERNSAGERLS